MLLNSIRKHLPGILNIFSGRVIRQTSQFPYLGFPIENEELARSQYAAGETILKSMPVIVTFGLTTFCNNRTPCIICDRNTRSPEGDKDTNAQVIKAVEPLLKTARYVLLHCGGEPMFSRHFDDVIKMINPPTRACFATNAMLMTKKRTDLMLDKDIMAGVVVSLDAATPEIYRIMRPSCDFQTVADNISYYTGRAKALNRNESMIKLNMTICQANLRDVPRLVNLAVKVGAASVEYNHLNSGLGYVVHTEGGSDWSYSDQAIFKEPALHDEMILEAYRFARESGITMAFTGKPFLDPAMNKLNKKIVDELCGAVPFEESKEKAWHSLHHKLFAEGTPLCFKPWREITVQPDGEVRQCCFHYKMIGNILQRDFAEIWNSDTMIKERKSFLANSFSTTCVVPSSCVHRNRQ